MRRARPSSGLRPPSPRLAGRRDFAMQRAWLTRLRVDGYSGHSTTQTRHTSSEARFKRSTNRRSCTVDLHPSPCSAGRGCRRRVRGDEAGSNELCTVPPTPKMRVGRSHASRLSPSCLRPPSPRSAGRKGNFNGGGECTASGRGYRASDPSTGTHLQPSWAKLGLRTTVPAWSPWLFHRIRQAAAAASTTRAVSRAIRKDHVNVHGRIGLKCAPGHTAA